MTEQDKQLLLIDLCGRLPYRVVINMDGQFDNIPSAIDVISGEVWDTMHENAYPIGQYEIKPYLRPMSSMTKEERKELGTTMSIIAKSASGNIHLICTTTDGFDWLNAHHFDYRKTKEGKTMIEAGLALEALEGMYNQNK